MPRITAIEPQKHDEQRVSVYLDGRFAFGAGIAVIADRHLRVGAELTEQEIEYLRRDDEGERAFSGTLNYLSFRPRSRRELHDYLRRKGWSAEVGEAVLERLEQLGLADDRAFARFWVENRQAFRPRGARALRAELYVKGVDSDIVDETLTDLLDEETAAHAAAERKVRSYRVLDDTEFLRRTIAHLQRRGFPYGVAATAARQLLEERGGTAPDELTGE